MFKPVNSKVNFPSLEDGILRFWREQHIFQKSLQIRQGSQQFNFYEGPPTANGSPGIHHVLARVFKDVIARYRTMKGCYVPRRAGWDTHGLPVELEVEKELGFTSKADIERYGIERFNARCRQSVFRYLKEWQALTERIGFWVDMEHPYITLDNSYIESCWWIIKELWNKGLIYQGHRVTPHCPRCGTSLSSHEVALGYDEADDPSVWVKFKVMPGQAELKQFGASPELPTYLLAWTTTPWTLPGNTALAVSPEAQYAIVEVEVEGRREQLILAEACLKTAIKHPYRMLGACPGSELRNVQYEPLYLLPPEFYRRFERGVPEPASPPQNYHVITADFVSLTEGTGIVHIAPAFGEVDYDAGKSYDLYFVQQVDERGNMLGDPRFAGKFVKEADPLVLKELESRRLLYRSERLRHTYPFCWRCSAPLLYYAKPSWYIKTTAKKEGLVAGNEEINWYPEHIKQGRFGDWLRNNVDWAVSRERYWGTPLNLWRCSGCGEYKFIGGLTELRGQPGLAGLDEPLDLHRPHVDHISFACERCGGRLQRVPEVLDAWFDSGAMPWAQWHYPFENKEQFHQSFPADFICEGVDQTRGWFYTLHALATMLFDRPCFKNVICLGHILDAKGEKMSKARGNVVEPGSVLKKYGADALRWYLYTSSPPGNVRLFSLEQVEQASRFLLTLWNTYSFFVTYANIDGYDPSRSAESPHRSELDRWVISELNRLVSDVTEGLEGYDPTVAARRIEEFVDDLSNWYVRRSRRRFWKSENDLDKQAAYFTLYRCLVTLSQLLAPFAPFVSEELYCNLVLSSNPKAPESVHLSDFPVPQPSQIDEVLSADTRLVMRLVSLGRAARSQASLKVRQPLVRALVKVRSEAERRGVERLAPQILEELNVKGLEFVTDEAEVLLFEVKPNLPVLGPKYGKELPRIAKLLASLDPAEVARKLSSGQPLELGEWRLLPEEVLVNSRSRPGFAVATEAGYLVAVDTSVSTELVAEGLARELVHRLQSMRKSAGFDIADYIVTYYQGETALAEVVSRFSDYIKQETLSRSLIQGSAPAEAYKETHRLDGKEVVLGVSRISAASQPG